MADRTDYSDLALRALDASAQSEQLMRPDEARVSRPSFTDLYRYVRGELKESWHDFSDVMRQYPDAAADLEHLLETAAYAAMPQLAAAASEAVQRREHDGYVLTMTASRADIDQVYLSIETGMDLIDQPHHVFIKSLGGDWYELQIPPMTNGRAQLVLERDDPAAHAFGHPGSVLYIR